MSASTEEMLYRQIVNASPDAIVFADRDGVIRLWNGGAERIFGYSAHEALGQTLDLIIPERQRARHWEGYRSVMATGLTRYGRELLSVPATRKDGTRISIEFSILIPRDASGALLGAAAILRDVTARWQQEKSMKERLAALEAQLKSSDV